MAKYRLGKLVRDNIGAMDICRGKKRLSDAEFQSALRDKLIEEAKEVAVSSDNATFIAELADVFEVIDEMIAFHGLSKEEILATQQKKRDKKGGFSGRLFIDHVEVTPGTEAFDYYQGKSEIYPEIVEEAQEP